MEDTLRVQILHFSNRGRTVLILVLMEDTLRETSLGTKRESIYSLNPCFNGRYS